MHNHQIYVTHTLTLTHARRHTHTNANKYLCTIDCIPHVELGVVMNAHSLSHLIHEPFSVFFMLPVTPWDVSCQKVRPPRQIGTQVTQHGLHGISDIVTTSFTSVSVF